MNLKQRGQNVLVEHSLSLRSMSSQTCLMWPSKGTVKSGHIMQVVA